MVSRSKGLDNDRIKEKGPAIEWMQAVYVYDNLQDTLNDFAVKPLSSKAVEVTTATTASYFQADSTFLRKKRKPHRWDDPCGFNLTSGT